MKTKHIPAVEARVHLGEIMKKAFTENTEYVVEKAGIPMVVIISATEYTRLTSEREERFKIIERIRSRTARVSENELQVDVDAAVRNVRKKRA